MSTEVTRQIGELRATVARLHTELTRYGLVAWTAGNVSARVPGQNLMVIKPSGVGYDDLSADTMVVCDLDGVLVEGDLAPSSDTAAHAYVYRAMPEVGGVVHTHSSYATAWAARGEAIPCHLTAQADEFGGEIPVGPFALIGGDDIGKGIVGTLAGHRSPAVLMRNHGVFTIGVTPARRSRPRSCVRTSRVRRTWPAHSGNRCRSRRPTSTRSTTATRTSTANNQSRRRFLTLHRQCPTPSVCTTEVAARTTRVRRSLHIGGWRGYPPHRAKEIR